MIDFGQRVSFSSEVDAPTKDFFKPEHFNSLVVRMAYAEELLKAGNTVVFNFHNTEEISIDALAYLLGNIEHFLERFGKKINGTYSQYERVNRLFRESGFLRLLKYPEKKTDGFPFDDGLVHLTFRTGRFVKAGEIKPLQEEVTKNNIDIPQGFAKQIFRALSEAMLNVHHHAYTSAKYKMSRHHNIKGKWWLGAQFDKERGLLSFVIYDIGAGIPATMPLNYDKNYLMKFQEPDCQCTDADLIFAATRKGKTSTRKRHRGRGLPDMHQIVENGRGELKIYSGKGRYYHSGVSSFKHKLEHSCAGTLVVWSIYTKTINKE